MRIGLQAWGSLGDIRPIIALAAGLKGAGHDVTLALTDLSGVDREPMAQRYGFRLAPSGPLPFSSLDEAQARARNIHAERHPVRQVVTIIEEMFKPVEAAMFETARDLCHDNDLVIGHYFHYPLRVAADLHGTPYVSATLVHSILPTGTRPPPSLPHLGAFGNRLLWRLIDRMLSKALLPFPNALREANGLPPVTSMMGDVWTSPTLNLIGVSPTLCTRPADWDDRHRVCGFFDLPPTDDAEGIPDDLERFLTAGPPPVYFGLGSMSPLETPARKALIELLTDAAQRASCRAIVQVPGWRDIGAASDSSVYFADHMPHGSVFPRCAAIVHHGGAGTTHTALKAGVPSVVVPHIAEQNFWAGELQHLGVAAKALPRPKLTAKALAARLSDLLHTPAYAEAAQRLGAQVAQENGVDTAVALIGERFTG